MFFWLVVVFQGGHDLTHSVSESMTGIPQLFRRVIHNELLWQPQLFGTQAKLEVRVSLRLRVQAARIDTTKSQDMN